MTRRTTLGILASLVAAPALAQSDWPQTTLMVPFPPGGSTDTLARLLAAGAQERLGAAVIVQNNAGAMGSIGAAQVAKSAPDGSSFLVTFDLHALLGALIKKPPLDIESDLEPMLLGTAPYVIAANPSLPYQTFADVVAAALEERSHHLFVGRSRHPRPSGHGPARPTLRHRAHPRSLQGGQPGDRRHHRRPCRSRHRRRSPSCCRNSKAVSSQAWCRPAVAAPPRCRICRPRSTAALPISRRWPGGAYSHRRATPGGGHRACQCRLHRHPRAGRRLKSVARDAAD